MPVENNQLMKKFTLHWATPPALEIGNGYGYYIHNKTLLKFVEKFARVKEQAKSSIFITSPEVYRKRWQEYPHKIKHLFTMFEGTEIPERYRKPMEHAEYLIAPSTWVKKLFESYFPPEKSYIVPHGVESDFTFKKRKFPEGKPFRWLWVGAPNPRKGYQEVINLWKHGDWEKSPCELYMKTTNVKGIQRKNNVIVDGRNLSRQQLVNLYHSAHGFLFPTRGEGFGLTLAEAMRTGLPCISTNYSGLTDFFDAEVGWEIGYRLDETKVTFIRDGFEDKTTCAFPNVDEMMEAMLWIMRNYDMALAIGKRANQRITKEWTWARSAKTLINEMQSRQ